VPWTCQTTVRMRDTDAAGVIFFPRLLEMAHDAYERLLDELGVSLADDLAGDGPIAPIGRCEADYRRPMRLGDRLTVEVSVKREGASSYALRYVFRDDDGEEVARAVTVHVAMDRATGRSVPLTEAMKQGLATLRDMA
jgi:1,4-dihydroxy-2-naphthoyl-CoA hydrolase